MGEEAFGLLTLIWMVVGYLSVLDFGVGQASVKYLAEQIGRGDIEKANSIVGVSVLGEFRTWPTGFVLHAVDGTAFS